MLQSDSWRGSDFSIVESTYLHRSYFKAREFRSLALMLPRGGWDGRVPEVEEMPPFRARQLEVSRTAHVRLS